MTIQDLIDQFEIQGKYCIKTIDDDYDCDILAIGNDFECGKWDIDENILERKITYMYAADGCLNIEVE